MDLFPFEEQGLRTWHVVSMVIASVLGGSLLVATILGFARDSMLNGGGREAPPAPDA